MENDELFRIQILCQNDKYFVFYSKEMVIFIGFEGVNRL